ncbi:hypothetical protein GCM10009122_57330 [Fulvivirga kasyanovii]|uniref:Uncharacterized protein n=1 Tax=Fulvivirga kasyanovii TaxID=396812 RepID=A0ABW9RMJ4_9BACT|nr:hypothetical protein [Fulvivirga kasyanovii]MTI25216.1 hypothetical protein [Fulvivirga kasyanovii]
MFSENEIATMIEIPAIHEATVAIKKDFISTEASMLDISEHDFLSLIMMTPAMGLTLSNGSVSLFEELGLNKMARKMSKGGYFLKVDPVAHAMKFALKNFDAWEDKFLQAIRISMDATIDMQVLKNLKGSNLEDPVKSFARDLMTVPYIFVRFLSTMILNDEADIVDHRSISQVEYNKVIDIGKKLKIDDLPVFESFCRTFDVK